MTSLLVTVIFLLADGTPAKTAYVSCLGVPVYNSGSDTPAQLAEGSPLILDSRAAMVIETEPNTTITCTAKAEGQRWAGAITFTKGMKTTRIRLKGTD
jgi:hypothetical protein